MHDRKITISTGASRLSKNWQPEELTWTEFAAKLANTVRTNEKQEDYQRMSRTEQGTIKDVGGFVGGYIEGGGRRIKGSVKSRSLLTLDADFTTADTLERIKNELGKNEYVIYSTHSHTEKNPKYRLVVPIDKDVKPEAYEAIARRVADNIGIDIFDPTTYEAERLMYWPSCSYDATPVFIHNEGSFIDSKAYLGTYKNWKDISLWPISSRSQKLTERELKKQGDPLSKPGLIGAFNRCYTIADAIEKFLSDEYEPCDAPNRYTYKKGSASAGLVVYDGGIFAYSHHGTDPIGNTLCNAYDLVRIHKFGTLDTDKTPKASEKAMMDFINEDKEAVLLLDRERRAALTDLMIDDDEALQEAIDTKLIRNKRGVAECNAFNVSLILRLDPSLKNKFGLDDFSHRLVVKGDLPWKRSKSNVYWTDADDACLRNYISNKYSITGRGIIDDCLAEVMMENKFHPVREFFKGLIWDGIKRIETLFIDYLGAEDNPYNRQASRKWLLGAVSRVMEPGCHFDNAIVIFGKQGLGKTSLLRKLAGKWFNNSITDLKSKDTMEQLQGSLIIELGEMAPTLKSEVEHVKAFISRREDKFRAPYGRRTEAYPRQCVFAGTTNSGIFLKDRTGNRRFWPIVCGETSIKSVFTDLTAYEIEQIWAEAYECYESGESLVLPDYAEEIAIKMQKEHTEGSEKEGIILDYLDTPVPLTWYDMDLTSRRNYLSQYQRGQLDEELSEDSLMVRDKICILEIWCELFNGDSKNITNAISREFNEILYNIGGWKPHINRSGEGKGTLRFGRLYGRQRAFVREP